MWEWQERQRLLENNWESLVVDETQFCQQRKSVITRKIFKYYLCREAHGSAA